MKFLVFFAAILAVSNAQNIVPGQCGDVKVVENFNVSAYGGLWQQIYRYPNEFEPNADCVTAKYTLRTGTNETIVDVVNAMVIKNFQVSIEGEAKPAPNSNGSAKLVVNFPFADNVYSDYWVLSTDYTSYSLVYACWDLPENKKRLSSWIISRTKTLKPQSVIALTEAFNNAGLNWDTYIETNQTESACKILNL